jgi:exopolyphosphatase/guanosine-5'-triphosphate,3'-diphosphate pyrophosphatase
MSEGEFHGAPPATNPPPHDAKRRAVIDVGTNSVKLLVADVGAASVRPVWEESEQTRLGAGFYDSHCLQPRAIAQTAEAVATFARAARTHGAAHVRVIGTSAARDAVNAAELCAAIARAAGLTMEIISGAQEAEWAFRGVTTDPVLAARPLLIMDVGGGSTEFILGHRGAMHFRHSFPLGSVRLLERLKIFDPPSAEDWRRCREEISATLEREVLPLLMPHLTGEFAENLTLVGTGGATTILARIHGGMTDFNRERIERIGLSFAEVRQHREGLWSLPIAARRQVPGLPPNRADVILYGAAIYESVMNSLHLDALRISTRGLRFAAVLPDAPA